MEDKTFMTVEQVAKELAVSESYAYKVIREWKTQKMPEFEVRKMIKRYWSRNWQILPESSKQENEENSKIVLIF